MRVAAILAAGTLGAAAAAQQEYTLTEGDQWERAGSIDPATPAGQLAEAREMLAAGDAAQAESMAGEWIKRYERDPLLPEAYLTRGDARTAQGNYYDALFDYEYVARAFPASEAFVTVLEREMDIATLYATGTKRKFLGMRLLDAGDVAEELMIRIQERLPGSQLAEQAAIELADYYFRRRKMRLAVEMYSIFLENFPNSPKAGDARRRLIAANLATFKGPPFDASGLHEARALLEELEVVDPAVAEEMGAVPLLKRIDESDAQKLLITAKWYLRVDDPVAAEFTIRRLVERYPRTVAAADAMRLIDRILARLPASVLAGAPDYAVLQKAILGREPGREPPPDGEP